jgi:hypothetical protein
VSAHGAFAQAKKGSTKAKPQDQLGAQCQAAEKKEMQKCTSLKSESALAECQRRAKRDAFEVLQVAPSAKKISEKTNLDRQKKESHGCVPEADIQKRFGAACAKCERGVAVLPRGLSKDMLRPTCNDTEKAVRVFCREEEDKDRAARAAELKKILGGDEATDAKFKDAAKVFEAIRERDDQRRLFAKDGEDGRPINGPYSHNNPGSLGCGGLSESFGATACTKLPEGNNIATFPNLESGLAAKLELFQEFPERYADKYPNGMTVGDFMNHYCPTKNGCNHSVYQRALQQFGGITFDTPVTMNDPHFVAAFSAAVMRTESGPFSKRISSDVFRAALRRSFER